MEAPLEKLYESANSTIYRKTEEDGSLHVLKVLKAAQALPRTILQFNNEYSILSELDIEGVTKAVSRESVQGSPGILLNYFNGIRLREYIASVPFNLAERLSIAASLTHTLGLIHQKNIIHRDLTSDNILVNPQTKEIQIMDFGQAIRLDVKTIHLSHPDQLEGSIAYYSPEQTGRMNRVLDYRSDLYSIGVVFYELFTGHLPFEATDPLKLIHSHLAIYPVPPSEKDPKIPSQVSRIIMVLLSKNAEDRYQSAFGLAGDLTLCLRYLEAHHEIESFELSHDKVFTKFQIPQKLYGREEETERLLQAFEIVTHGHCELMLVSGYSGVGKTALVNEVHKPITSKSGYFIKGKFDQYNRNIPYSAFTQALNEYCHIILTEPDDQLALVRKRIQEAVGHQGKILIEIIPDLESIIGPQEEVAKLEPVEHRNRLNLLLLQFFRAIAIIEHPLVIFLDDLQWADTASLDLLQMLSSDKGTLVMLMIGAYRDNEVDDQHGLSLMIAELQKDGIQPVDLKVMPLPYEDVRHMIEDTLHQPDVKDISRLIYDKTKGNAFFTIQFIRHLLDQKLLFYTEENKTWEINIDAIKAQSYSENVIDLMILKIKQLEKSTQETLTLASIFGTTFNMDHLSSIIQREPDIVLDQLWPCLSEGYLTPVNDAYRMVKIEELKVTPEEVYFSFSHDRIQQAAYQLIPAESREILHLNIGRMLYAKYAENEDYLFDIANHYNLGANLITEEREFIRIRDINIKAGLKAKKANAVSSSIRYLLFARNTKAAKDWENDYRTTLNLNRELAEAYYLNGELEASEQLLQECIKHALDPVDKADIYYILMLRLSLVSKYDETLIEAVHGLKELGYVFPTETNWEEITAQLTPIIAYIQEHPIPSLENIPWMTDPKALAIIKIMDNLSTPLYVGGKTELWILHALKKVQLSLDYGMSYQMCYAFSEFGLICCILGMFEHGLPAGDLAKKLSFKYEKEALRQKGRTGHIVANYVYTYFKHIGEISELNQIAYKASLESGELIFAGYTLFHSYFNHFFSSDKSIPEFAQEFESGIQYNNKIKHLLALHSLYALEMCTESLMDPTTIGMEVRSHRYDVKSFMELCLGRNEFYGPIMVSLYSLIIYTMFGDYERAKEADAVSRRYVAPILASPIHYGLYMFTHCWLYLEMKFKGLIEELPPTFDEYFKKIELYKTHNPDNFEDKFLFLSAIQLRNEKRERDALSMFEKAIEASEKSKFIHMAALGHEKLAELWIDHDRNHYATYHILQANVYFTQWGAFAKVEHLKQRFKTQLDNANLPGGMRGMMRAFESNDAGITDRLDLLSMFKASQTMSGILTMEELKKSMMEMVMECAGASKVSLILPSENELRMEVIAEVNGNFDSQPQPLSKAGHLLPVSLINFVNRKRESVLLNEVAADRVFYRDPYFENKKPQSIWALPLLVKSEIKGILYMENNIIKDAFTEERVNLLQMLSYQLGISIENVKLYENLSEVNKMYQKFVPLPFLHTLGHDSILNVKLGDQIQREMTILFTDIRSYTTISENLSPEENFSFINEYLSYTAPCVEQHGGFINSFTGDGIMALFAEAEQALQASIALQQEVRRFNKERENINLGKIKIGTGLHTGGLMLGVIGDEDRHDTGVISNEVNTASRIEGLTKMFDSSILLSDATLSHLTHLENFDYRFLGLVQVKGRTGAVKVYECFSGDPVDVIEMKKKTLKDFDAGLTSYFNKDFIVAAGHLKNVLTIDPGDVTADRYFRHAAELMVKGVGPDWTGVEIMTEK